MGKAVYIAEKPSVAQEFAKALKLAKEKQERDLGDFSILKIIPKENMTEEYHKLENYFRSEDIWGMDWKKNVYVLLANTSEKEAEIARLKALLENK